MSVEPSRIRQIGMVVQLEDGTVVHLHSKPGQCEGGQITINRETEVIRDYYQNPLRVMHTEIDITVEGLTGYEFRVYRAGPDVDMVTELTIRELPAGGGRGQGT